MTKKTILWSDERISQVFVQVTNEEGQLTGHGVMFVVKSIRDEYETKIDELEQKLLQHNSDSGVLWLIVAAFFMVMWIGQLQ